MQFVIILYEAAIIYDRERAARRCAALRLLRRRVSYAARRENYLISDAADKPSNSAREEEHNRASSVIALVETHRVRHINFVAARQLLGYRSCMHEEEIRTGRLRETHVESLKRILVARVVRRGMSRGLTGRAR